MLFFDHGDFVIQLSAERRSIEVPHVHIKIHGLLFRRRNDVDIQFGFYVVEVVVDIKIDVVRGMTVFRNRRTPRHDLGIIPDEPRRIAALFQFHQIRITVQVIEIFEQSKIELLFDVRIFFGQRKICSQIDGKLFVTDGVFQNGFVCGF